MASYEMRTDHPCRDCGKLTPYFPQCLACTFENPRPKIDVVVSKSNLRRAKARRIESKERLVMFFHGAQFYDYAKDDCPSCGAQAAIVWRAGGAFQQRTECICGRKTRWVVCGHDATANTTDAEVLEAD